METEQKFFVYVDYREDDGKPFYVGKGNEHRVKNLDRNQLHKRIKNKHGIFRKILFETYSEQEAFQKEIELIQELKTHIDFGEGGANFTLGGEGSSGMCEVVRKKMSESIKKAHNNPEFKKKRSESVKKNWEDPEHREKMSEANKYFWAKPESKKKKSEASKKFWENPENKKKCSEAIKKSRENPEVIKKISEASKKLWEDLEHKKKISEKMRELKKKRWEDPEFSAMMKEKMRLGREKSKVKNLDIEQIS